MKKVFMFVNVDWFFLSHRLPIAMVAAKNNIDMSVYTDFTKVRDNDGVNKFKLLRSPLGRVAKYPGYEFIELIKVFFFNKEKKAAFNTCGYYKTNDITWYSGTINKYSIHWCNIWPRAGIYTNWLEK